MVSKTYHEVGEGVLPSVLRPITPRAAVFLPVATYIPHVRHVQCKELPIANTVVVILSQTYCIAHSRSDIALP